MHSWLGYLLAFVIVLAFAPLFAWLGRRHGRTIRGASGLALILMGLGQVIDPPRRHLFEATEGEEEGSAESGEPKVPDQSRG